MDTVLCLDTSGSMYGSGIQELKRAVGVFITTAAKSGLDERISIVEFGGKTQVTNGLTNDYRRLSSSAASLSTGGSTPMAQGLVHALTEISNNGKITVIANSVKLNPRVVLMSDGHPNSEEKVRQVTRLFAQLGVPIACVGVKGCDQNLLRWIADTTGGMFTMADEMAELSSFFLRQVLLTLFIAQFARDMKKLYSLEALRHFMQEKTGRRLNDAELSALLMLIRSIASAEQRASTSPSPSVRSQTGAVSRTSAAKSKPKPRAKTGNALFVICLLVSSIAAPYLVLHCWQAHTETVGWLSGGLVGGLGWQGRWIEWGMLGLAVVTYLVSRWTYSWADNTWRMPLDGSERASAFVRALIVFGIVSFVLFGWLSWPVSLGYATLGAIGISRKHLGSSW